MCLTVLSAQLTGPDALILFTAIHPATLGTVRTMCRFLPSSFNYFPIGSHADLLLFRLGHSLRLSWPPCCEFCCQG